MKRFLQYMWPTVAFVFFILPLIALAQVTIDNTKNGSIALVSGTYDASVTTVSVNGGHGARLPSPPFRCSWWNATDYARAYLDPNVEVIRATANPSTDTYTVQRGISGEGTTAHTHSIVGKTYQWDCGLTAGLLASLAAGAAPSGGDINSSGNVIALHVTSPVPVTQGGSGIVTGTAHGPILAEGTSAFNVASPGSAGQIYTSNGAALDGTFQNPATVSLITGITGNLPVGNLNSGTGAAAGTVWHGNATWGAVSLTADISGNLPVSRLNSGTSAGSTTFWAGDATWKTLGSIPYTESPIIADSTITDYGGAWNIDCPTACTVLLPTVTSQTGSTESLCVNDTSAPATIDANGSQTINGSLTRIMVAGECAIIAVRSGEWKKLSGRSVHLSAILARTTTLAIVANTWTVVPMPLQTGGDAIMFNSANGRASILRSGNYAVTVNIAVDTPATTQFVGTSRNLTTPEYAVGPFFASSDASTRIAYTNVSLPMVAGDYFNAAFFVSTTGLNVLGGGINIVEVSPW